MADQFSSTSLEIKFQGLKSWQNFTDIPEALVYLLYSIAKILLVLLIFTRWCGCLKKIEKVSWKEVSQENSCGKKIKLFLKFCCFHIWKVIMKINSNLVRVLFTAPTGSVTYTEDDYREPRDDNDDIPKLYIRRRRVSHFDVAIMAMVTLTFLLVIFSTFWDRFWLTERTIETCIDKQGVFCYPLMMPFNSGTNFDTNHWITNCSEWVNHNNVMFRCFQFTFNFGTTAVSIGGLITSFKVTTKLGAKLLICLTQSVLNMQHKKCCKCDCCSTLCSACCFCCCCKATWHCTSCNEHCSEWQSQRVTYKSKMQHIRVCENCKKCEKGNRYCCYFNRIIFRDIVALVFTVLDITVCVVIAGVYFYHIARHDQGRVLENFPKWVYVAFENFNKVILPLGIVTTSLFLPLEDYAIVGTDDITTSMTQSQQQVYAEFHDTNYEGSSTQMNAASPLLDHQKKVESYESNLSTSIGLQMNSSSTSLSAIKSRKNPKIEEESFELVAPPN